GEGGRAVGLIAVGGSGGVSGDGGTVQVTNDAAGQITVRGAMSSGIFAQSIGGGGGNAGGVGIGNLIGFATSVGGGGGGVGGGGAVTVTNYGAINTLGVDAQAIFAESVGGGGGNASISGSFTAPITTLTQAFTVNVGGSGAGHGDGGAVQVTNAASG